MRGRNLIAAGIALMIMLTTQIAAAQSGSLPPEMLGSEWTLVSLQSAPGTVQDTTGKGITARFDADGSVSGSGGCNNFRGGYTVASGQKITFTQFASTLKACEQEIADREQAYLTVLQGATSFTLDGSAGLQLTGGNGQILSYTKSAPTTLPTTGAASDTTVPLALFGALCCAGGLLLYRRRMLVGN